MRWIFNAVPRAIIAKTLYDTLMRLVRLACASIALSGVAFLAGWAGMAALTWSTFGRHRTEGDRAVERFMPEYEVEEWHETIVHAPADIVFDVASAFDLRESRIVDAIFRARELILRAPHGDGGLPAGLLEQTKRLGWKVLYEEPHRIIIMGAVTRPWEPRTIFRSVAPAEFVSFSEPDYVKILWTLESQRISSDSSIFRTVTYAITTDAAARRKFRCYWSMFAPGISLIRLESLRLVRRAAERRFKEKGRSAASPVA